MRAKPKRNFMKDATPNRKALEGPGEGWAGLPYGSSSTILSEHPQGHLEALYPTPHRGGTDPAVSPPQGGGGGEATLVPGPPEPRREGSTPRKTHAEGMHGSQNPECWNWVVTGVDLEKG